MQKTLNNRITRRVTLEKTFYGECESYEGGKKNVQCA